MVLDTLKRLTSGPKPVALLFILLLASLYLMSSATQNSAVFSQIYSLVLAINFVAILLLLALILRNLLTLIQRYRRRAAGSRLTVRLVAMFVVLAVVPVSVVYYFALGFLQRGIDSWFELNIEQLSSDALQLGQLATKGRLHESLRLSRQMSLELAGLPAATSPLQLNELRRRSEASDITLLTLDGKVIASSSERREVVPDLPNSAIMAQLRHGREFAQVEPIAGLDAFSNRLQVRVAVTVPAPPGGGEERILHALFPLPERLGSLADSVEETYNNYKQLNYLRDPLKASFVLTLTLILLLTLLTAVWAAFFSARRLVAPISDLAEGTQAVAAGNYDKRLPLPGRDELGFLVRSFNEMTRKIARARDDARRSQDEAEEQRAYLAAVLGRLSSGVLTLDQQQILHTANEAAGQILGIPLQSELGHTLDELAERFPVMEQLQQAIHTRLERSGGEWRTELELFGSSGRRVLMCRGTSLPGSGDGLGGHVIVFDDITTLIQAQRDAAWGEVARRLAHEIKNPLTPIQLSAERLRHKYLNTMPAEDANVLDRATHTIVQQVETMKEMVKAFSDYARPPRIELRPINLNNMLREVLELYAGNPALHVTLELDEQMPTIQADSGRLRQVLHNLIKNALEAASEEAQQPIVLHIHSRCAREADCRFAELSLHDNGPGISDEMLGKVFEPYITSKPRGTGLGLAIVKKIIEEHGGMIWAENHPDGGAQITLRLPVKSEATGDDTASDTEGEES